MTSNRWRKLESPYIPVPVLSYTVVTIVLSLKRTVRKGNRTKYKALCRSTAKQSEQGAFCAHFLFYTTVCFTRCHEYGVLVKRLMVLSPSVPFTHTFYYCDINWFFFGFTVQWNYNVSSSYSTVVFLRGVSMQFSWSQRASRIALLCQCFRRRS